MILQKGLPDSLNTYLQIQSEPLQTESYKNELIDQEKF
ncbi:hypothetical protein LEP1GSC038_4065 [Leptospira weilii str. 2006001855]|uniref:Uncharacterized protein n=2 Tax=Leptospira weilii TaxID=28184 RepID=M6QIN3_9LEPT|nr:hypothetical protein LEP1GSC038_4065 [Leptospira weilii str. 2006001855]EMN92383.1 hypothetical protein LEP1GSC108_1203 [Leptospira weilii str. UI 13098]